MSCPRAWYGSAEPPATRPAAPRAYCRLSPPLPAGAVVAAIGVVGAGGAGGRVQAGDVAPLVGPGDATAEVPAGFVEIVRPIAEATAGQAPGVEEHRANADWRRLDDLVAAYGADLKH